jgi:hypothetical protein
LVKRFSITLMVTSGMTTLLYRFPGLPRLTGREGYRCRFRDAWDCRGGFVEILWGPFVAV